MISALSSERIKELLRYVGTGAAGVGLALLAALGLPVVFADDEQQSQEPVVLYGER